MLQKARDKFVREIWHEDVHTMERPRQIGVFWVRMVHLLVQELTDGYMSQRAASLAYTSILSLVPFLAFAFALLKGFGFQNKLQPVLLDLFSPMGPKGVSMTDEVISFVNNVNASALGTVGLLMLLFGVISLTRKVEMAFNFVWRVREPRSLASTAGHYLGVIMVGPLLMVAALGITATISNPTLVGHIIGLAPAGVLVVAFAKVVSFLLVIGTFTFLYVFVPYTHVQLRSAITGGLLAGVLWELSGWAFTSLSHGTAWLSTIYASFAILMMFIVWLYVSWMIVLAGTQTSYYVQNPDLVRHGLRRNEIGGRTFERVALHIMYLLGRSYTESSKPWSREQLARRLHLPTDIILDAIDRLQQRGLIIKIPSRRNIRRYMPARDMSTITLRDIMMAVRQNPRSGEDADKHIKPIFQVDELVGKVGDAIDGVLGTITLKDFIGEGDPVELSTKTVLRARQS